jgi:hypothetical protein
MREILILVETISGYFALFSCALFAGAATYVSLVERPAIAKGGGHLASAYLLFSQPRPTIFQTSFAAIGGLGGILAGWASSNPWWAAGGIILSGAALFNLWIIAPQARNLQFDRDGFDPDLDEKLNRLSRLYGLQSIAGLGALFIYIVKT